MLEVHDLNLRFGSLEVTRSVNLRLARGDRHALIGPNGAGKTTLVNLLTGTQKPDSGRIILDGVDITRLPPYKRARLGLARTYQINSLFLDLTPLEAVALAITQREGQALKFFKVSNLGQEVADEAMQLLDSVGLAARAERMTRELPYGLQRLLEVALALATHPKLLLLDEPAAGVPQSASDQLFKVIDALPQELAILLIEHDMRLVFHFAQEITVMVSGAVLTQGNANAIAADPRVRDVYLGHRHAD